MNQEPEPAEQPEKRPAVPKRRKIPVRRQGAKKGGVLSVRQVTQRDGGGRYYDFWMVQGWREPGGSWGRRKFTSEEEARTFMNLKAVEKLNNDTRLHHALTELSPDRLKEAEAAIRRLAEFERHDGGNRRHTLTAAVEHYLRAVDEGEVIPVTLARAAVRFIDARERAGVRQRSLKQLESTLSLFGRFMDDVPVAEVKEDDVKRFLAGVRSKTGAGKASPKTHNNYRGDLHNFFRWCVEHREKAEDGRVRRLCLVNPCTGIPQRTVLHELPGVLSLEQATALMRHVETFQGGRLVPYFSVALFGGLRTGSAGEMHKLAAHPQRERLIDLERGVIHVKNEISKTGHYRQVILRPNLKAWLSAFGTDLLPPKAEDQIRRVRREFSLSHDVLRHSFISYHVSGFKSVGEAALEAGNSEAIVRKHYLNLVNYQEGAEFWAIMPAAAQSEGKQS